MPTCLRQFTCLPVLKMQCFGRIEIEVVWHWPLDPLSFLPPELAMVLLIDRVPGPSEYPRPDWECPAETFKLAMKWAENDLLHLEPSQTLPLYKFTRIFNARKSEAVDRQIGDRRGMNSIEGKVLGPSRLLPQGESLCALSLDSRSQGLALCISDRRDYNHQLAASVPKAASNRLFPSFPVTAFKGTRAYDRLVARVSKKAPPREATDDNLGGSAMLRGGRLRRLPDFVQPCFRSVLQGDHIGVEVAAASHDGLLKGEGLFLGCSGYR